MQNRQKAINLLGLAERAGKLTTGTETVITETNKGKIINADVNGSINILRKYIKNIFSPNLEIAMDIGREQRPLKKRVA